MFRRTTNDEVLISAVCFACRLLAVHVQFVFRIMRCSALLVSSWTFQDPYLAVMHNTQHAHPKHGGEICCVEWQSVVSGKSRATQFLRPRRKETKLRVPGIWYQKLHNRSTHLGRPAMSRVEMFRSAVVPPQSSFCGLRSISAPPRSGTCIIFVFSTPKTHPHASCFAEAYGPTRV